MSVFPVNECHFLFLGKSPVGNPSLMGLIDTKTDIINRSDNSVIILNSFFSKVNPYIIVNKVIQAIIITLEQ